MQLEHPNCLSSFSIQNCRGSRPTGSGISECSTASWTHSSTHCKLSLCHRNTTRRHRSCGLNHTQWSDTCRGVECARWVGSCSRDRVRSTISGCSRRRRINGIGDDRAARIDGRVWLTRPCGGNRGYGCGLFLLSNGFCVASSAGA